MVGFCPTVRSKFSGWLIQHSICTVGLERAAFAGIAAVPTMLGSLWLQINVCLLPSSKSLEGKIQRRYHDMAEMRKSWWMWL